MNVILPFFLILFSFSINAQEFDAFFRKNVKDGLVDYAAIKKYPDELNAILKEIANAPERKDNAEKAFLINTYNTLVIKGIIDHYPVDGPLKIDGFFDKQTFNLRGKQITLNQLEKEILMKQFPDPRLHFVLVCAAEGCPKLATFAYSGHELETQIESQTRKVINNPDFIRLNGSRAEVSQVFDWYAKDFGGKENVIPFIQKYLLKKVKLNPTYSFYAYDWSLNDLK